MPTTAREFDEVPSDREEPEPESEVEVETSAVSEDVGRRIVGVSSDATQTEGDVVDGSILVQSHPLSLNHNNNDPYDLSSSQASCSQTEGGFLSHLFTMVLPVKRKINDGATEVTLNSRTIATQTEEQDPICARGHQLSHLLIQEFALHTPIPRAFKDDVYESLASCICDMLVKHSILFNGMVRRCHVTRYHIFSCIANEIFEVNESNQLTVTWGRIISLFAFAVRLSQEYREDPQQVECIIRFLASYVTKHLVPFIRSHGGWANLVEHYPAPVGEDAQMKRAMLWSGLCVGLMATMYVSSYLSSR